MNIDKFDQQIKALRKRIAELVQHSGDNCQQQRLIEALEELHKALEELELAEQELHQQNEELSVAQTAVEVERQRYRDLFEFAPDGYVVTDALGVIREANRAAVRLLNVPQHFLVGKPLVIFIVKSERQVFRTNLTELQQMDWFDEREVRLQPFKSGAFDAALTATAMRNSEGKLLALRWLLRDISERKQTEMALRESEERYALAVRGANDGLWDWDLKTNEIYFSPRWKSMLGYAENDINFHVDEWFNRVHPQDINQLRAAITAHLEGLTDHLENEHRILHSNGEYCWMLSRGLAVRDADNLPYRIAGSQTDITKTKVAEAQLVHNAFHDALTGLPNRLLFMDRLAHALKRAKRREDYLFAVLFLDLDRFKVVNDSLGHLLGDQLLIAIAHRLQICLRPGDTVARLGGDEFTILLENIHDVEDATQVADRIQNELQLPFSLSGHEVFTAASIGIALSTTGYDQPEDLLRDADVTMYRAKKQSKTAHYEVFDRTTPTKVGPLQLESDLRRALERQELCLHYQPIVDLGSGNITGFETLVRLKHPERGLVPPAEFIPMAEETGLIVPIGWWVLWEACRQIRAWQVQFPKIHPLKVNVNFSSQQFSQSDLITQIDHVLQETGLNPCSLGLEITESAIMENAEGANFRLKQLREMGVKLFLDNFGTGYSSLSYLHRFAFNSLKIDRSFVSRMGINGKNLEIVRSILTLAHTLEMNVIAEGVETATQLVQLTALKCEYGQGHLFSQPLECEATGDLIALEQHLYGNLKLASTCSALQKYAMK